LRRRGYGILDCGSDYFAVHAQARHWVKPHTSEATT